MRHQPIVPAWLSCLAVLAFGFGINLQLAKFAPYVDRLGTDLGIGLTYAGWLTSLMAVFVALGASAAGSLIGRVGTLTALFASAAVLMAGALLMAVVTAPAAMLTVRALEAIGYVFAVVAAPAYLALAAPGRLKPVFLALWGSVVPVGFALANLLAGGLPANIALSSAFLWFTVPLAATALLMIALVRRPIPPGVGAEPAVAAGRKDPIAWVLALGFGLYVYLSIAFFTFQPTFADAHPGPGLSPGVIAMIVPVGSLSTALILARWRRLPVLGLTAASLLLLAVSGAFVFVSGLSGAIAMPVYAFASGISASCLFAAVPAVTRSRRSATRTIGAVAQAGGIATLVSPPIAGSIIEHAGWSALAVSFVAVAVIAVIQVLASMRVRRAEVRCA